MSEGFKERGIVQVEPPFRFPPVNFCKRCGKCCEAIGVFSHGGAIHDTIASVERY